VNLADIPAAFDKSCRDTLTPQSLDALEQIYGYMAFNNNKFGILTNWQRALFLRRAERPNGKTLEYYLVELDGSANSPISMLKAWVGMVLLAEDDCSYVPTCYLARNFGTSAPSLEQQKNTDGYRMRPINGEYQPLPLHLCHFDLSSARRGATGCVLNGRFPQPYLGKDDLHVIYKVVDVLRYPDAADWIEDEARAYAALRHLQGQVIPTLYGFYEVWGIIHFLVLEPVGNAIREDEEIDQTLRIKMQAALRHVHDAGFVHGDIARRNFCRTEKGDVFLVDLELCKAAKNQSELSSEMEEVDKL
jgi:hypothetical protein